MVFRTLITALAALVAVSCGGSPSSGEAGSPNNASYDVTQEMSPREYETGALIYNGVGAASGSYNGIAQILNERGITYRFADAADFNAMSVEDFARYGVIIIPGGLGGRMTAAINAKARARVREAVRERGVSYAGFCAGTWMAVGPMLKDGITPDYGFAIVPAAKILPEFAPNGKIMNMANGPMVVTVTLASQQKQDLIFYGGSYFPDAARAIARYKDGKPAIVQAVAGRGFLVMSGPHPEASDDWHKGQPDDDGALVDRALAGELIEAALSRKPLPSY